jgi:hypothetical protein
MACPFFKKAYVGYCSASDFPYTPSIIELEKQCFKDSLEFCVNFKKLHTTASFATDAFTQSHVSSLTSFVF